MTPGANRGIVNLRISEETFAEILEMQNKETIDQVAQFEVTNITAFEGPNAAQVAYAYAHSNDGAQNGANKSAIFADNFDAVIIQVDIKRSFRRMFSTTYLPTMCLLIIVHLSFYFPEDNFQVNIHYVP